MKKMANIVKDWKHEADNNINENTTKDDLKHLVPNSNHEICKVPKPLKLQNILYQTESYDTLHSKGLPAAKCLSRLCLASTVSSFIPSNGIRTSDVVLAQANDFLDQYFTSIERFGTADHKSRWNQVRKSIETIGYYQLTKKELIYGAKVAWRNAPRCILRIQWSKLQIFDCRHVTTTVEMFRAICNHIEFSTNNGNIKTALTIFPQRTDCLHDYRIWNNLLIAYAGYKQSDGKIVGDPLNVKFTEFCLKLGWKGKRTEWDILPLVVSANGQEPDYFDYPPGLVLEVPLTHPKFKWFEELNLRWYALIAVSRMLLDCGGIQFPASPFSAWYTSFEIGSRNLCDPNRKNILKWVANKMRLDTTTPTSLWKDKALIEINIAVLHSYQSRNVTIVDHHSATESFMKHFETETKLRNGCPADWIWIVPPMSGSVTPVYHQEMALYYLKPSFEYQDPPWKNFLDRNNRTKFHFKQIAIVVRFLTDLYGHVLSKRIKATVLYASETGKAEQYAKQLCDLLGHAFNAQIFCMTDYNFSRIKHEVLLLIVAATSGNGDPPENGKGFYQKLQNIRIKESRENEFSSRFAVFAIGSSAYLKFCAFGKNIDRTLVELGGERLLKLAYGDHMSGQEVSFRKWALETFKLACETFCLDPEQSLSDASLALQNESMTLSTVRFVPAKSSQSIDELLSKYHNRKVRCCQVKCEPKNLTNSGPGDKTTILLEILVPGIEYDPGDHVGIFPENDKNIVEGILARLTGFDDPDEIVQLQLLKEKQTSNGIFKNWEPHDKIPSDSIRGLLLRYFDITTPPSRQLLTLLGGFCEDNQDAECLRVLVNDPSAYEDWRHWRLPHLLDVLEEFPSCKPPAFLVLPNLMPLQSRFYSISSSQRKFPDEIHLTIAVVKYCSEDGKGAQRFGVCSNYLAGLKANDNLYLFVRSAPSFHLPTDPTKPIILIGPGTGIAPFRSFWQHLEQIKEYSAAAVLPKVWLFFGCRSRNVDLYADEKEELCKNQVLDRVFLALSREKDVPKTYVQDLIEKEFDQLYRLIVEERGHVYVCGDVTMAEHVYQTIRKCVAAKEGRNEADVDQFLSILKNKNQYHEDIFGIVFKTSGHRRDAQKFMISKR